MANRVAFRVDFVNRFHPIDTLANHAAKLPDENGRIDIADSLAEFFKGFINVSHLLKGTELRKLCNEFAVFLRVERVLILKLSD